ncbi:MAG: solute:sodium symporter family transporter [Planctomycetota bacterium]|nr:MAG: solute:sodium symporter family transporter [Planctomycetota bacterium]
MLSWQDWVLLFLFLGTVAGISLWASRGERTRRDYFLAGRSLPWWLIGFSLIASNISTEHFVGMTGTAARSGFAVASYEWLAAPALVFVAWWLLPRFLKAGIYTMPEYLEYRFDRSCRSILASFMVVFFVLTVLATVLYSGATFLSGVLKLPEILMNRFDLEESGARWWSFQLGVWGIGIAAGIYTIFGGLKAVVWSDLLQGGALLAGGTLVAFLALHRLGEGEGIWSGWHRFAEQNREGLHVIRSWNDPDVPSLSLITGLWIPVMFYWGLNQFITQRTLAAGSLAEGQKGILFAALIKLFLPFLVVIPGMMAVQILADRLPVDQMDGAYPMLLRELLPAGLLGLMLAAVAGSIMSTFNSGLNSAATVFTLDLWSVYVQKRMTEAEAVRIGRIVTALLAVGACLWAPVIHAFDGVFQYIQEFWGFVSAPTCAVFFAGMVMPRVPAAAARCSLLVGPLLYLLSRAPSWVWTEQDVASMASPWRMLHAYSSMAFLYHMFVLFLFLLGLMAAWGGWAPRIEGKPLPEPKVVDLRPMKGLRAAGYGVLALTAALYLCFW